MRAIRLGALSLGALAFFTFAGGAAAQTRSPAVLNSLEVRELITRAEPADHARLEVHFAVLAEQYAADAKRHSAMALAFIASPIRRAAGKGSAVPRGAARFEAGAGAAAPSAQELTALAAKASTPADHRGLEEYFLTSAKRYTAEANDHAAMAMAYRGTKIAQAGAHCDRLVTLARDSAKEATEAAAMHKQLAGVTR